MSVIITVCLVIVLWPACGAIVYRFMNWLTDEKYDEEDMGWVLCLGPLIAFLLFAELLLEICDSIDDSRFFDNVNKSINNAFFLPFKRLAGKPTQDTDCED